MSQTHVVIFSHGFGVRQDSRGMFTDIVAALPKHIKTVLFDYGQFDGATNTLTVPPLSVQVEKLREVIATARKHHPSATIDLLCHSQGCVVAGLLKPTGEYVRKIILIAPPAKLDTTDMQRIFARPGAQLDFHGNSRLPRRDGTTTIVPQKYWQDIERLNPVALYNALTDVAAVRAVHANQDEIIGDRDFSKLRPEIKNIYLDANHDFTGAARPSLIHAIQGELERVPVVNEKDEVIAHKFRDELKDDDIYRVSALWIKNSKGAILLAQRSFGKHHDPGRWQGAVAGTVEEDETYLENIIKETSEEIGIENILSKAGPKTLARDAYTYFVQWFTATVDKPAEDFKINKDEVLQVRWFTPDELHRNLRERPNEYTNGTAWALENL